MWRWWASSKTTWAAIRGKRRLIPVIFLWAVKGPSICTKSPLVASCAVSKPGSNCQWYWQLIEYRGKHWFKLVEIQYRNYSSLFSPLYIMRSGNPAYRLMYNQIPQQRERDTHIHNRLLSVTGRGITGKCAVLLTRPLWSTQLSRS